MKSKIITLYDYKDFPFERTVHISCPKEYIDDKLKCVARRGKTYCKGDSVEKRDVLTLDLKSRLPKYNKTNLMLTAGSGLFDIDFENALMGRTLGETLTVDMSGVPVTVRIKDISRAVYPPLTQEMLEEFIKGKSGYDSVTTVETFCARVKSLYIEEKKKEVIGKISQDMYAAVLDNSEFYYDPEELESEHSSIVSSVEDELREENLSLDTIGDDKCREYFGVENREELQKMLLDYARETIASSLWIMAIHDINTDEVSLDDADSLDWSLLYDYISDNINFVEE